MKQTFHSIPEQILEEGQFAGQTSYNDFGVNEYGNLATLSGLDALLDVVRCAVQTNLGELQYDVNGGVPHMQTIFTNISTIELWKSSMREVMESIEGVISVEYIELDYNSKEATLSYTAGIRTIYGNGELNGERIQLR